MNNLNTGTLILLNQICN